MKRLGSLLMMMGVAIGAILAISIVAGVRVNGMPLLVSLGLSKLTFGGALGLLAAGAFVRRVGIRREKREHPPMRAGAE